MYKLEFENAVVVDNGYRLEVNGEDLSTIISTMLGTRVGNHYGYGSGLPNFKSTCCDVKVIINPKPVTTYIDRDDEEFDSLKDLKDCVEERYEQTKGTQKADEEE